MQPSSFNTPQNATPPSQQGFGAQPANTDLPNVPPPPVPASAWLAATDQNQAEVTPNAAAPSATPALADDGDLIEKEWVSKVKQIVNATANDPYEQNVQFTRLKAEYMQKRYGKQIKVED